MQRVVLAAGMYVGYLCNKAFGLLEDKYYLLRVKAAHCADAVFVKGMLSLARNMGCLGAESAILPVMGLVHIPGFLRRCRVRPCIVMVVFNVLTDIAVAYASVRAVTALCLKTSLTASLAKKLSCRLASLAYIA